MRRPEPFPKCGVLTLSEIYHRTDKTVARFTSGFTIVHSRGSSRVSINESALPAALKLSVAIHRVLPIRRCGY
jgi:hypothetical protein